jgi:hypothetical protein
MITTKLLLLVYVAAFTVIINTGCTKEPLSGLTTMPPPPPSPPPATQNNSFKVNAGQNSYVPFPTDSCFLAGSFSHSTQINIGAYTFNWRKIFGSNGCIIDDSTKLGTKVRGLQIGTYEFELTVKGPYNEGRDTVKVFVAQVGKNEMIFKDLKWTFPWYATLPVAEIFSYFSPRPIKVFIQRSGELTWQEVTDAALNSTTARYEYFIESRHNGVGTYLYGWLHILYYGSDTNDSPAVKVIY